MSLVSTSFFVSVPFSAVTLFCFFSKKHVNVTSQLSIQSYD